MLALQPRDAGALTGEAFDERRKLRYSLLVSVRGNAMTTEGCMLSGVVCKSLHWVRVP